MDFNLFAKLKDAYAKIAQQVYNRRYNPKPADGMCSYIAPAFIQTYAQQLRKLGYDVGDYWGPDGFSVHGRDHHSVAITEMATGKRWEIDIPEQKYQDRIPNSYYFQHKPKVVFNGNDVSIAAIAPMSAEDLERYS